METGITVSDASTAWVIGRRRRGEIREITARDYLPRLDHFARSAGADKLASRLTRRDVEQWRVELAKMAQSSQRSYWSTVRLWLWWLRNEGILDLDPMDGMRGPKEPHGVPRALRLEQVRKVLAECDQRERLVVLLMVQMGLRRGEVAAARIEDLDLAGRVMLVHGKGGKERVVPIPVQALAALETWLGTIDCGSTGPLIRSRVRTREGLRPETVGRILGDTMKRAGIKQRPYDGISGHAFRHTAATDMLRSGAHVRDVQAILGHSALVITERYLPLVVNTLEAAVEGRTY